VPQLSKEQILCVLERFRSLDLSIERNRERLVDALAKCIVLYDDKLIITVTFRDEPIVIMTSEEVADVARLGSDINSLTPPARKAGQPNIGVVPIKSFLHHTMVSSVLAPSPPPKSTRSYKDLSILAEVKSKSE